VRRAEVFRDQQGIDLRTGHRATSIDRGRKVVCGATLDGAAFEQPYDKLLIATGAAAIIPEIPGAELPGVLPLKTLADGRRIKALLAAGGVRHAVILGMGYVGMEMCESLRALGIGVDMVKPRPEFMPGTAPELAQAVRRELEDHGVGLHAGAPVERIEARGGRLRVSGSGLALEADLVLAAVGVKPNSGLAREAGLALSVREAVAVDRKLATSDPEIFAAGDCADAIHVVTGRKTWIPLALRANRAGWAVADTVCGEETALDGVAGTAVFRVFGLEVARTGLSAAEAAAAGFEPAAATIRSTTRAHRFPGAAPLWVSAVADRRSGRLLGMQLVGREGAAHRINAAAVALHAGLTLERFAQADLAYAPPFGPSWDPMLTCARELMKQL
jgi:NADPH-dependent 2,4-dienoyl-CoA reductase/sulfur reductase-like enzyme